MTVKPHEFLDGAGRLVVTMARDHTNVVWRVNISLSSRAWADLEETRPRAAADLAAINQTAQYGHPAAPGAVAECDEAARILRRCGYRLVRARL